MNEGDPCWFWTTRHPEKGCEEFWGIFDVSDIYLGQGVYDADRGVLYYYETKEDAIVGMLDMIKERVK